MRKILLCLAALVSYSAFCAVAESGPPRIVITPSGTGAGNTGELRLKELVANGNHHTGFKAPDSLAASVIYTLPNADGTNGYVLSTNGSGILSWVLSSALSDGDKGDITVSGTGSTFTIDNTAVSFAKIQNVATDRLAGRDTTGSGSLEEIAVGGGIEFTGSGGIQRSALTGDVTASAGSNSTTIANNAVTTAKIADANVTYAKVATAALTSFQRKNLIINPRFDVWQRGTSFSSIPNNTYVADRFKYIESSGAVHDASRSTDVPTVASAGVLANYSILLDCTTADTGGGGGAIGVSSIVSLRTTIEGYDFAHVAQRGFTLSFWVKATKTGTYVVSLGNSTLDRGYAAEYTVNSTDTWEKKTINVSASPSAGTWDYTNGAGLHVSWILAAGTNYNVTANSWQTTTTYASSSNQVNACDSTSNNFRLTLVQLEAGDNATNFEYRPFATELELCQRYYEKNFSYSVAPADDTSDIGLTYQHAGAAYSTGNVNCPIIFKVRKRTASYGLGTYRYNNTTTANRWAYVNSSGTIADFTSWGVGENKAETHYYLTNGITGMAAGYALLFIGGWACNADF